MRVKNCSEVSSESRSEGSWSSSSSDSEALVYSAPNDVVDVAEARAKRARGARRSLKSMAGGWDGCGAGRGECLWATNGRGCLRGLVGVSDVGVLGGRDEIRDI